MVMTMFPWIRICIGGLCALLKLDQYVAFGKTLATVKMTEELPVHERTVP